MSIVNKIIKVISDKQYRFHILSALGKYDKMPDEKYLKKRYKLDMGVELDLNDPKTLNEKLQWLKLYNRKDIYTVMVDKYLARDYIAEKLGKEYLIPLLGVWDKAEDINFDELPEKFVLKCNHNSGMGMFICRDKSALTLEKIAEIRKNLNKGLKENYYLSGREWPYKNVKPRIIAEKYMTDSPGSKDFTDYKFFCFNGFVDCVMVCLERSSGDTKFYFFDKEWQLKKYNYRGINAPEGFTIPKPEQMDEMFKIASKLSEGIPFVRVDLYVSDGQIYFGEMTFFPQSGFDPNLLPETDKYFGSLIDLSIVKEAK